MHGSSDFHRLSELVAKTKPIQVLYVSHYNHLRMGGQQSMVALIENLDRRFFRPMVVLPSPGPLAEKLAGLDCWVHYIPLGPVKPKNFSRLLRVYRSFRMMYAVHGIDIVHPDAERDAFICGLAKLGSPTKMMWHVRLTQRNRLDRWNASLADGIIGISEGVRKRLETFAPIDAKYRTIFNGVDCSRFTPHDYPGDLRSRLGLPNRRFILSFIGQFKEGKGVLDLLHALPHLHNKIQPGEQPLVLLIGQADNPDFQRRIKQEISSLAIADQVRIVPFQNNIHEWMQASDAVVLPSHEGTEGMGRVLFEAMACGAVAMGSDISGIREVILHDSGILFPERSPDRIANAIAALIAKPEWRATLRSNGIAQARARFSINKHARNVEEFYFAMLGRFRQDGLMKFSTDTLMEN